MTLNLTLVCSLCVFVLVMCRNVNSHNKENIFSNLDTPEINEKEIFKRDTKISENYRQDVEDDFQDSRGSMLEEEMREEMRSIMGDQQIRHGRSRNHFSRFSRDKKLSSSNALHYIDQKYEERDDHFASEMDDSKYPSLIVPVAGLGGPAPPTEVKEDKYDLRSFFGITSSPLGADSPADRGDLSPASDNERLNDKSAEQHVVVPENKTLLSRSGKDAEKPTVLSSAPSPETMKRPDNDSDIKKDKFGNNVYTTNNILERPPPKSSLESVQVFINYKNRSKKKDDSKHDADTDPTKSTSLEDEIDNTVYSEVESVSEITEDGTIKIQGHADIVTRFLRIVESQHLLGENCTAGTDLNLGEGVVDRYAQERFRVEADVAVNRANMLTRLWKYAGTEVMHSEYLLHASVFSMVEFDDDIFAAGNCYDQYQYKEYQLFCPFAYRLPEGPILVKDLAVEYKYLSNTSEWFYIARKNAENVIRNYNQFSRGFNTYTYNESAHTDRVADEILSVTYEDGKWSKPYYDCGGGNIWMLTYTVPFFGYANDTYFFKGTSGIDIDLRRVDIDQCPLQTGGSQLNIFAATDKCKKRTTDCVPLPGLGFRRGSYKCVCKRGFYFPDVTAEHRFYNGTVIEEEYEKLMMSEVSRYSGLGIFECLPCAEGCEACTDNSPCVVSLNWLMRTAILVLDCVVICCLPIVVFFTWKYGNVKVVRAASPVLLRVIALGALFIYCTNIVMYPRPTVYTCTARVWLREIGFCLTYGALMLKTWRISVIFRVRSAKAVKITDFNLLKRLGIIVAVFSVFLVIRTLVAPPVVIVGRTATDLKAYLCKTDWWDHSFTTLEVIFLIWGIRLCIVVRKAPSEFNESRFISMAIYNEFLLSVFLNISMLFLQSPANPDLLYIIFFCHTQLTVTLLLCLIFGSKAYLVYRGHGKGEHESSSMVAKTPAGKFIAKPRSGGNSQYATSTNSSAGYNEYTKVTEQDIQEEFRRLYMQLENLKDKNMRYGNRHLTAKISAMQEAAARQDSLGKTLVEEKEPVDDKKKKSEGSRLNNMFSAMADKLSCSQAITPAEESTSSGREYVTEGCESSASTTKVKRLNVTFSPIKNSECDDNIISEKDNVIKSNEEDVANHSKSRQKDRSVSSPVKVKENENSANGCDKCLHKGSSAEADNDINSATGERSERSFDKSTEPSESDSAGGPKGGAGLGGTEPDSSPNNTSSKSGRAAIKSGHARTHAIVINLDDKSRFTEEVTV